MLRQEKHSWISARTHHPRLVAPALAELKEEIELSRKRLGFVPNSMLSCGASPDVRRLDPR